MNNSNAVNVTVNVQVATSKPSTSDTTEVVFILDRSGSMSSIADDAIGGFNRFITEQKELALPALFTLVQFDHEYDIVHNGVDIYTVPLLNKTTYKPRGMTAYYDAIAKTFIALDERNPKNAIVVVMTDGQENASKEYQDHAVVKKMVQERESRGWQVLFLGANIDVKAESDLLGVSKSLSFKANTKGVNEAYSFSSQSVTRYRSAKS